MTTIGISFTMSVALSEEDPDLVFPGESEIGWDLLLQLSSWTECGFPVSQSCDWMKERSILCPTPMCPL